MSEGTIRVRLRMSWRGHRWGEVVDMPSDDHTYAWLGLGLCDFADEDPWVESAPMADPVADVRWDADRSRFVPLLIGTPQGGMVESVPSPGDSGPEVSTPLDPEMFGGPQTAVVDTTPFSSPPITSDEGE